MIGDKRFVESVCVRNLLSFGPQSASVELKSLNVLIGPNGAGKSNLLDALTLLQAAPRNLLDPVQKGGGIAEWFWKGADAVDTAELDVTLAYPEGAMPLRHRIALRMVGQRVELADESIENVRPTKPSESDVYFYYRYQAGRPVLNVRSADAGSESRSKRHLQREDLAVDQSVLSQRKDPDQYPELTYLGRQYSRMRFFREWSAGRNTEPRKPRPTDLPADYLDEDASNVALVLNDLEHRPGLRSSLVEKLRAADGTIADFSTRVLGGTIQLFLHYEGLNAPVPATRLSDGTFRYLCLLAVLCHPSPPPLVCLEEPELGLHPDLLPSLADLLMEASHRMQLLVTTHSDVLVDGLTSVPEAVLICEKDNGATRMTRHSSAELEKWLDQYGLGQLWRSGEIGGNRW